MFSISPLRKMAFSHLRLAGVLGPGPASRPSCPARNARTRWSHPAGREKHIDAGHPYPEVKHRLPLRSSATATGLPQPSDALSASAGTSPFPVRVVQVRRDRIGGSRRMRRAARYRRWGATLSARVAACRDRWPSRCLSTRSASMGCPHLYAPSRAIAPARPPCSGCSTRCTGTRGGPEGVDVRAVPDERLLALGRDELVVLELVEMMGQRRARDAGLGLDLADHQAVGMGGEQEPHDAEPRLGAEGGEHVGEVGDGRHDTAIPIFPHL